MKRYALSFSILVIMLTFTTSGFAEPQTQPLPYPASCTTTPTNGMCSGIPAPKPGCSCCNINGVVPENGGHWICDNALGMQCPGIIVIFNPCPGVPNITGSCALCASSGPSN